MKLETFIIELLKHNNCVVVPNFGGFIANYHPAVIDQTKQKISPPSKHILFNAKLLNNDGLLANYIVEKQKISYPNSLTLIEQNVQDWRQVLATEKRLVFGEIGYLFEQDGHIIFEQNREVNLLLEAYGLSSISFIPIAKPKIVELKSVDKLELNSEPTINEPVFELNPDDKVEELQSESNETKVIQIDEKQSKNYWKYIAVACMIPLLFYTYWIPMQTDFLETGNIESSDFNPFNNFKAISTYQNRDNSSLLEPTEKEASFESMIADLPENVKIYHYKFDEELYIPVKLDEKGISGTEKTNSSEIFESKSAPIQLIAGCFSIKKNARTLIDDLSKFGYSAYILDKNKGLYRVATNGFKSMIEAKKAKKILQSKDIQTWVLKK